MKKILLTLIILILGFTLITRFISYKNPDTAGPPSQYPCIAGAGEKSVPGKDLYPCTTLSYINDLYLKDIKPIFKVKCLMCHGIPKRLPLYAKIPPGAWLVNKDRREAKEHINMTWDFPFRTKKGVDHGLEEIAEMVNEGKMPPIIYQIMHWNSELSRQEKKQILQWVGHSRTSLKGLVPVIKTQN